MSVGKITELVDDSAIAQLEALYQKLGITTQAMKEGVAVSVEYTNAIGKVNSITEFNAVTQQASSSLVDLKEKQLQVIETEKQATAAKNQVIEATKAKAIADADASAILQKLGGDISANIKLLVEQKIELAQVVTQLKEHQKSMGDSSASQVRNIETTAKLTQQQLLLKEAIAQNTLVIKQQTKEQLAAETSNNMYMAQLNQLIKLQNTLSAEEKEATVYGKELQLQIEATRAAMVANNEAQGKFNDNVGNYPGKAEPAIASIEKTGKSMDVMGRLTSVLTSRIFRLAASFLLITVAFGAIEWLYKWISGLDMFTGRLDKVIQGWKTWSDVMAEGNKNAGEGLAKLEVLNKAAQDNNLTEKERIAAAEKMKALWPDKLKNLSDEAIMNGEVADSIKAVTAEIEKQALAEAGLKKITDLESKILDEKTLQEKLENVRKNRTKSDEDYRRKVEADAVNFERKRRGLAPITDPAAIDKLIQSTSAGTKKLLNEDINAQIADSKKVEDVLKNNIKVIEDNIGLGDLAKAAEGKPKKDKKVVDKSWEIDLANARARLEYQKAIAKEALDNDKLSYDQRLTALSVYIEKSNALINLERDAKNRKPGITKKERETNSIVAETQRLGVTDFSTSEQERLAKERSELLKKNLEDLLRLEKDAADKAVQILQEQTERQLTLLDLQKNKEETLLVDKYAKGLIDEKEYRKELLAIQDQYNIDRLGAIAFQEQSKLEILQAKENNDVQDATSLGASSDQIEEIKNKSGVSQQKNTVSKAGINLQDAINKQTQDQGKGDAKENKEVDLETKIGYLQQLQDDASKIVQQNYENEIALLEKRKQLIQETADFEISRVQNSILSSKEKAREEAVIREQQKQQEIQVDAQITKIKEKQAKYDRALSIANIIENTAVGASKAAGTVFGLPLVPVILALGAAQLATVLATPLPKFEKGGTVAKDGPIITGEAGTELRIDPTGAMSLTADHTNITYAKAGTKIISNKELQSIVGKPEPIYYVNDTRVDNRKLEKLMQENNQLQRNRKERIIINTGDRWGDYSKRRNY